MFRQYLEFWILCYYLIAKENLTSVDVTLLVPAAS